LEIYSASPELRIVDLSKEIDLGEQIDPYIGALSFRQVDLALPGDAGPSIIVSRRLMTKNRDYWYIGSKSHQFMADWELEIPSISTIRAQGTDAPETLPASAMWTSGSTCRDMGRPPTFFNDEGDVFLAETYWHGYFLDIPETGPQAMLARTTSTQIPGTARYVTRNNWIVECLPGAARNASGANVGAGFVATSPAGTKYFMTRYSDRLMRPSTMVGTYYLRMAKSTLFVTEVRDVHGNSVYYQYNSSNRLTKIYSNDGRSVTLSYNSDNTVSSISTNGRVWNYSYVKNTLYPDTWSTRTLTQITRPDGTKWKFDMEEVAMPYRDRLRQLSNGDFEPIDAPYEGTITTPAGLKATYFVQVRTHRQSNIVYEDDSFLSGVYPRPSYRHLRSLVKKQYSGPGISTKVWQYSYSVYVNLSPLYTPDWLKASLRDFNFGGDYDQTQRRSMA
jgi:YD repeat-containing protein